MRGAHGQTLILEADLVERLRSATSRRAGQACLVLYVGWGSKRVYSPKKEKSQARFHHFSSVENFPPPARLAFVFLSSFSLLFFFSFRSPVIVRNERSFSATGATRKSAGNGCVVLSSILVVF